MSDYYEDEQENSKPDEVKAYYIPRNAINKGRFLGVRFKHWLEAIVIVGLIVYITLMTPFTVRVKGIVIATLGISLGIVFLRGFKGRTLLEFIIFGIRDIRNKKQYHLGGIHDDRKAADKAQFEGESGLEKTIFLFKRTRQKLDERYGVEDTKAGSQRQ